MLSFNVTTGPNENVLVLFRNNKAGFYNLKLELEVCLKTSLNCELVNEKEFR